jgi:RNA polymerase sigma-70 factor (ECF subfamily)
MHTNRITGASKVARAFAELAVVVMGQHEVRGDCNSIVSDVVISLHLKRIYLQIYRVVQTVDDAQELTQDVFIKALRNAVDLKDTDKLAHWLSRIASNVAIDFIRRRRHHQPVEIDGLANLADKTVVNPEYKAISHDEYRRSTEHLEVLTDRERTALLLRDVEEWPTSEVALQMGCSRATVRSHIANARVKLRECARHPATRT